MIQSIRHKGLKRLYEDDDHRSVIASHAEKLHDVLARLDAATDPQDLDLPGFRLHALRGNLKGYWAIVIRANWRVIFRLENGEVLDVDYIDYH